jgi:hypothetical protein
MLSGHGKPVMTFAGSSQNATFETASLTKPFHLPGLVLSSVAEDLHYHATIVGPEIMGQTATIHLRILHYLQRAPEQGSDQDWWFDASTYLPLKVTYYAPGQQVSSYAPLSYYFSAWMADSKGLVVPQVISETMKPNIPMQSCSIQAVTFNTQPASTLFDAR